MTNLEFFTDHRNRELLPIGSLDIRERVGKHISRGTRQRISHRNAVSRRYNDAAESLNELYGGFSGSDDFSGGTKSISDTLLSEFQEYLPATDIAAQEAVGKLLGSTTSYDGSTGPVQTLASYDRSRLALPSRTDAAHEASSMLDSEGSRIVKDFEQEFLRPLKIYRHFGIEQQLPQR